MNKQNIFGVIHMNKDNETQKFVLGNMNNNININNNMYMIIYVYVCYV